MAIEYKLTEEELDKAKERWYEKYPNTPISDEAIQILYDIVMVQIAYNFADNEWLKENPPFSYGQ